MKPLIVTHTRPVLKDDFKEMIRTTVMNASVNDYLKSVNERAVTYAITNRHDLAKLTADIESDLTNRGVKKKNLVGTQIHFKSGGRGRGWTPVTEVKLKRVGTGWRLIMAEKSYTYDYKDEQTFMLTTEATKDILDKSFMDCSPTIRFDVMGGVVC